MAKARFTVTAALVAAAALLAPQAASADRAASKQISAKRGGVVKTPRGAKLYVPAGVLRHNARATITPLPGGRYDIHIAGAWFGPVRVTVPLRGRRDRVMHQVDEVWVAEGRAGQRTVWTSQLSLFGSLETMKKVLGALRACAFSPGAQLITCLINQGFKEVEGRLYSFLASKIPNKCWAALVEASLGAGAKSGAIILSVAWTAWLKPGSPCIGRASAPAPPPSNPQPSPPAPAPVAAPAPSTPPT
ncbi:MAG: hypothetical protein DYG90_10695, partial [Chloroflexi bacterium CFX6]|nr:hypothetical protein [Chloroflexi bacterium CFX6]